MRIINASLFIIHLYFFDTFLFLIIMDKRYQVKILSNPTISKYEERSRDSHPTQFFMIFPTKLSENQN